MQTLYYSNICCTYRNAVEERDHSHARERERSTLRVVDDAARLDQRKEHNTRIQPQAKTRYLRTNTKSVANVMIEL